MSSIMDTPCVCGWGGPGPCPCPRNKPLPVDGVAVFAPFTLTQPRQPWECPSCHLIHAPHVDRCTCKQPGLNVGRIAEGGEWGDFSE